MSVYKSRILKYWVGLLLVSLILTACASPTAQVVQQTVEVQVTSEVEVTKEVQVEVTPTAGPEGPVTLVIWANGDLINAMTADPTGKGAALQTLKDMFEKDHPGVTLKFEDHGWDSDLRQNLTNALLAGNSPDIIVGEGFFKSYANLDALVPIDISDIEDNLVAGTYEGASYKGKVYGLAFYTGVFGFERNCDVVSAAGLDCNNPPKTWDDLLAEAKTITDNGGGQTYGYTLQGPAGFSLGSAFRIAVLANQLGAPLAKPGPDGLDIPNFNDPLSVPAYEFLRQLNQYTPPGLTFEPDEGKLYSQLHKGVVGYQIGGSWHVNWAKENGCTDCRYSEVPVGPGGKPASIIVGNVLYGVLKTSKHQDLALEFIKYQQKDEVQDLLWDFGRLPATRSALTKLRATADPATQAFIDVLLNSENLTAMPQFAKNVDKIWTAYGDMLTSLFTTDEPVQGLLDKLQQASEDALK